MTYLWIKALHLVSVIAWYAGLFYVFRLFVYHVKYRDVAGVSAVHAEMERKLLRYIMAPAMVASIALGGVLVFLNPSLLGARWLWVKLACVVGVLAYHGLAEYTRARFARGDYVFTERACRAINEVQTLLLVGIVVAVVVRPL
jgi:putative membrane protein